MTLSTGLSTKRLLQRCRLCANIQLRLPELPGRRILYQLSMKVKKKQKRTKKIVLSLSERDYAKLTQCAASQNVTRSIAAKRLIHAQLATLAVERQADAEKNQLGLFDSLQIDIFNQTSKT